MMKERIGLIGVGNMGTAILEGLLKKQRIATSQVMIYDKIRDKTESFAKQWNATVAKSNGDLAKHCDVLLLAVKPQDLSETAKEIAGELGKKQVVISILAGIPLSKLKAQGLNAVLVRAMPNLGAKVGEGITAITSTEDQALQISEQIFSACGKVVKLDEKFFDLVTALSGSGPAYFFYVMELLAKEGVQNGLTPQEAELLAVQTAVGAALLIQQSGTAPHELRQMVTSKGGTTEAALRVLQEKKFPDIFHEALQAALKRGKELSQ